jgi:hypothetical protein
MYSMKLIKFRKVRVYIKNHNLIGKKQKPAFLLQKKAGGFPGRCIWYFYYIWYGLKRYIIFDRNILHDNSFLLIQASNSLRVFSL